ncbi:hypothetical protein HYQ46_009906 [Verticillium longisporum]|nr:hypothetical protein HYQ46_009906 [Verticillium longisporum]
MAFALVALTLLALTLLRRIDRVFGAVVRHVIVLHSIFQVVFHQGLDASDGNLGPAAAQLAKIVRRRGHREVVLKYHACR